MHQLPSPADRPPVLRADTAARTREEACLSGAPSTPSSCWCMPCRDVGAAASTTCHRPVPVARQLRSTSAATYTCSLPPRSSPAAAPAGRSALPPPPLPPAPATAAAHPPAAGWAHRRQLLPPLPLLPLPCRRCWRGAAAASWANQWTPGLAGLARAAPTPPTPPAASAAAPRTG